MRGRVQAVSQLVASESDCSLGVYARMMVREKCLSRENYYWINGECGGAWTNRTGSMFCGIRR
jgi:hypothetical protein